MGFRSSLKLNCKVHSENSGVSIWPPVASIFLLLTIRDYQFRYLEISGLPQVPAWFYFTFPTRAKIAHACNRIILQHFLLHYVAQTKWRVIWIKNDKALDKN